MPPKVTAKRAKQTQRDLLMVSSSPVTSSTGLQEFSIGGKSVAPPLWSYGNIVTALAPKTTKARLATGLKIAAYYGFKACAVGAGNTAHEQPTSSVHGGR